MSGAHADENAWMCRCQRLQAELDERLALLDRIESLERLFLTGTPS